MINLDTVRAVAREVATPGACYAWALIEAGLTPNLAETCHYFSPYDGQPLCLVGQVVDKLGVRPPSDEWEGAAIDGIPEAREIFTQDALDYLAFVQSEQDGDWNQPWVEILDALDTEMSTQ